MRPLQLCENCFHYFIDKVTFTGALISPPASDPSVFVPCCAVLDMFEPVILPFVQEIVSQSKPSGSIRFDTVPPRLFKEVFPTTGPSCLTVINSSLSSGVVPVNLKHAVVQPLPKPGLDPAIFANYRPISKLPFFTKILEKIVCSQPMDFLNQQNILEIFQSGFKTLHCTESVLLRIFNDIFLATASGHCVVLLDLTAAFDTVEHEILIAHLEQWVGISGTALQWFRSYLSHQTFCVSLDNSVSSTAPLSCWILQGFVLDPLLFSLYLLPLGSILR